MYSHILKDVALYAGSSVGCNIIELQSELLILGLEVVGKAISPKRTIVSSFLKRRLFGCEDAPYSLLAAVFSHHCWVAITATHKQQIVVLNFTISAFLLATFSFI